jgi:hypothetical protein
MRFLTRAAALATVAILAATVVMFRPGSEPVAEAAQAPDVPPDLALVPADAVGFVHVRGADLWKNDVLAPLRETYLKAGPKVLAALDAQFVPKISTFDRGTAFVMFSGERKEPVPFFVLRFTEVFDPAAVVKAYAPDAERKNVGGKAVFGSNGHDVAFYFPDNNHMVVSSLDGLVMYLGHDMPKTGAMSYGLKLAASGRPIVGSVNLAALPIPPQFLEQLPPDVQQLLKAQHVTASLDLGAAAKVELTAGYKTADDAAGAEKAVKALAEYARKELAKVKDDLEKKVLAAKGPRPAGDLPEAVLMVFGIGALNHVDELLADPGKFIKRNGSELTASVTLPKELAVAAGGIAAAGAGLLLPAVQKVREAAGRAQGQNNLKQIGLAIHNYHDANGHMPQDIVDKNGKPLLSWRVAILPYIEQENVYKLFKMDEPWDSENNKIAASVAIKTFLSPQAPLANPGGMTHYQAFVGPGTAFEPGKKLKLTDFTDGTSNTILVVETADAVEWAKPGGIPFDPKKALPKLPSPAGNDLIAVLLGDGSVRTVNLKKVSEKTLKDAITRNDGNPLGQDWDR